MRRFPHAPVALFLLALWALGGLAQQEAPPSNPSPPQEAPSQGQGLQAPQPAQAPAAQEQVVPPSAIPSLVGAARKEILAYLEAFAHQPLAEALHAAVVKRGVRAKVLVPMSALDSPDSYAMSLLFLSLKYANLEVKVLRGGRVDPRVVVDGLYMLVGYPLEGLAPEVRGPLLLVKDPARVGAERERFLRYWSAAPYCAPDVRYQGGSLAVRCVLSWQRP